MYGDSEDSDSSDDATGNTTPLRANGADSDEELRVRGMTKEIYFVNHSYVIYLCMNPCSAKIN
jgi:hypothetical protein